MVAGVATRALGIALFVAGVGSASACEPSLNERTFLVSSARVLAVRADPPEALPGAKVTLTSLYVDLNGTVTSGPFDWAFCEDRNPLANLGPVSATCATRGEASFLELGRAQSVTAALPLDACRVFGPDVPSALPNEPPGRPVDPDATGGYYQPVRLLAGEEIAIGLVRATCDVPGASPDQIADLSAHDHANANPAIDTLSDPTLGTLVLAGAGTNTVAPSQHLALRARWAACDPLAPSCSGAEGYAFLDPQTHQVVHAREQIRVSWSATGGALDDDTTGRDATDATPYSDDGWTAPATTGSQGLWVVIRDDRGGIGWRSFSIDVK
jgi:hypothetical protein